MITPGEETFSPLAWNISTTRKQEKSTETDKHPTPSQNKITSEVKSTRSRSSSTPVTTVAATLGSGGVQTGWKFTRHKDGKVERRFSEKGKKKWKEISKSSDGKFELREVVDLGIEISTKYRRKKMTGRSKLDLEKKKPPGNKTLGLIVESDVNYVKNTLILLNDDNVENIDDRRQHPTLGSDGRQDDWKQEDKWKEDLAGRKGGNLPSIRKETSCGMVGKMKKVWLEDRRKDWTKLAKLELGLSSRSKKIGNVPPKLKPKLIGTKIGKLKKVFEAASPSARGTKVRTNKIKINPFVVKDHLNSTSQANVAHHHLN